MLRESDPAFIRWSCRALAAWRGPASPPAAVRILGAHDVVFPPARQRADHVIAGGGHAMALTHADAINPILDPLFG
jgi:hypothetical protein